jgi:competence protein ComGF
MTNLRLLKKTFLLWLFCLQEIIYRRCTYGLNLFGINQEKRKRREQRLYMRKKKKMIDGHIYDNIRRKSTIRSYNN